MRQLAAPTSRSFAASFTKRLAVILFLLLAAIVAAPADAQVAGTNVNYTVDADFDRGSRVNVNHDAPNSNQLQLSEQTSTFPFIWIALSNRGTIAKIDTRTGAILGEYSTTSDGDSAHNPSRTTVGLDGSAWAGNRDQTSAIHVGLREANQCIDRNGDGDIDTSTGYGDVLAWPGGSFRSTSAVSNALDECILHYVDTDDRGGDARHVSVTADNDVWIGSHTNQVIFQLVDGATGTITRTEGPFSCGGYGGLVDGNGVVWSAKPGVGILRWDPAAPMTPGANPTCLPFNNYGLAIDGSGNIWASTLGDGVVRKFSPAGVLLGTFGQGNAWAQGLTVDGNGDVWIAHSLIGPQVTVGHLKNNGTFVGNVTLTFDPDGAGGAPATTSAGPTGIAVDAAGKIWSANEVTGDATRIDPTGGAVGADGTTRIGAVDARVVLPGARPYNYSDMTGAVALSSTSPQGTWTVIQDGEQAGRAWGRVVWNTEAQGREPAGTSITFEARAADTTVGLAAQTFVPVSNNTPFSLTGRFLEVRATLRPDSTGASPVLSDVRICAAGVVCREPANTGVTVADSPDPVNVRETITYTITVPNAGPGEATGVTLTDILPGSLEFVSASASQGTCSGTTTVTCALGSLARGASATVTIVARAIQAGSVSNSVSVAATEADPNGQNNTATATTTVNALADAGLTKAATASARVGENVTYTLTTTNAGPSPASGVVVTDTLPSGIELVSASASQGSCAGAATVTCAIGTLASGSSATVTIVARATAPGTITNTAQVSATEQDPASGNNSASATTTVEPAPVLPPPRCRLTITPNKLVAGRAVLVRVAVSNLGTRTPAANTTVRLRGPGIRAERATGRSGFARFRVLPARAGTLRVRVPAFRDCAASLRIARQGVGAGLTGRL
jgi:uncharacterized repeat protein (TIGR01451 family)